MQQTTLCYLVKGNPPKQILLGMKKRGFGAKKLNGIGGKTHDKETILAAAVRELEEEICVKVNEKDLEKIGEIDFFFPFVSAEKNWNQTTHVFAIKKWLGTPAETEEIKPFWIEAAKLPFEQMWKDDPHWMPLLLANKKFKGKFVFAEDNESIKEFRVQEQK